MNKAFVREPDDDGRAFCPRCSTLGVPVNSGPLDTHIRPESRAKMLDSAWFCNFYRCDVAYFNQFGSVVLVEELKAPVYPKDPNAPICACFGLTYDEVVADADDPTPNRIRAVVAKQKAGEAECHTLAPDGRSCLGAVQELYMRLRSQNTDR
jgi:CopZ-like zinc binding protein